MRKFGYAFVVALLLMVSGNISAQLYVSPNSYVYVNNQFVTVTQDVNLQSNGNIYLRSEGQLLQKTAGASGNQGLGELSLFQEGTSNNFSYNYWCSPVGMASASVGNSSFGISQLSRPTAVTTISSLPATILPSSSLDGSTTNSSLSIAQRWIFKFLSGTTYANWQYVGAAATLGPGEGFTMKGTSGTDGTTVLSVQNNPGNNQRYDFKGKPNDGTIGVNVIATAGNMTLTGNPYPSAIDLSAFLTDAANIPFIDGTALFWEHDPSSANTHVLANYRGGYGVYNGATNIYTPAKFYTYDSAGNAGTFTSPNNFYERKFSPVGQGFMIRGTNAGTVYFKNSYRIFKKEGPANNSEFHKNASDPAAGDYGNYGDVPNLAGIDYSQISKAPTPHMVINGVLNNQGVGQIVLCFLPDALDGVDHADSKSPDSDSNLPYDMYLYLDHSRYVHSATSFDINKGYPIGFKNNTEAIFRIQVARFVNFNQVENVYLHDKQTDVYHDIKNGEYEMTLPAGVTNDRFEITFINRILGIPSLGADTFEMVQNNETQSLTVANPKLIDLKSVSLYDLAGKLIFSKTALGSKSRYQFPTSGISDAIYVVKIVTTGNQETSKKITVHNSK